MDPGREPPHRPPPTEPAYRLEALRIGRRTAPGGDWLLHDVSLAVEGGERVALVGPTGSGKTLLLRALAVLDRLDAGEVRWNGEPVAGDAVPRFRSLVVHVGQRPALLGETVEENLRAPLRLAVHCGREFDRDAIVARLRTLHRDESFLRAAAKNLSGGERQIVALLRALQLEPAILLLDEPTAALDAGTTATIERLILDWQTDRGTSFVWVSHNAAQVERLDARVVTIRGGRVGGASA